MNKKSGKAKSLLEEKEKALQIIKNLIGNTTAVLSTKYLKSHEKVAILYKDHLVELYGGDEKYIKYMAFDIPLSTKEHKEVYRLFMDEVKKRNEDISSKKLDEFKHLFES